MKRFGRVIGIGCFCALVCGWAVNCSSVVEPEGGGGAAGKLRVLVTDKPYPYGLIAEATVTITRVEVRRAGDDADVECSGDADCDDAVFCNGAETCDEDGECLAGAAPCDEDEVCDEAGDECASPCTSDAECDDTLFCNGSETCDVGTGLCVEGAAPCFAAGLCDEDGDACLPCADPIACDDGLFCTGVETCDLGTGACVEGVEPCTADEECDEVGDQCVLPSTDDDVEEPGDPWVVIFEGTKDFNLLDLQNGRTDLLADATVPEGTYTQMRLIVTEGTVVLDDDEKTTFVLTVPSGAQTGIKLHFTFDVAAGEETTLLLDVDLSRAFRVIPGGHIDTPDQIRGFHFQPSVALRLINLVDAGSISGIVTDAADDTELSSVSVTAFMGGEEVTATATDEDGTYVLTGLTTGVYRVEFSKAGYQDFAVEDVSVAAGATTEAVNAALVAE